MLIIPSSRHSSVIFFNSFIKQEKYPDASKKVEIIPIVKKGHNQFTNLYRFHLNLAKYKKTIFNKICFNLVKFNLSATKFGFRRNYSITYTINYTSVVQLRARRTIFHNSSVVDHKQRQPCITRHGELMEQSLV